MALTKAQKQKLAKQGFTVKDIADIEAGIEPDEDEPKRRSSGNGKSGKGRVLILEGADAESFLDRFMGGDSESEDEPKSRRQKATDEDDEDDEDDENEDDEPKKIGWFG